jgi:hypothetical protein
MGPGRSFHTFQIINLARALVAYELIRKPPMLLRLPNSLNTLKNCAL